MFIYKALYFIIIAVVVLGPLIFVHELGHFIFAKLFGVKVETFSLGFGRKLIGKKIGETEYILSLLPLGGYVKMLGDSPDVELAEEEIPRSFLGKAPIKRIVIVAAGPIFNIIFAYLIFVVSFMIGVPVPTAHIGDVMKGSPAEIAGLKTNDLILSVNNKAMDSWVDFTESIAEANGRPLAIKAKRGDQILSFNITPAVGTTDDIFGEKVSRPMIGVSMSNIKKTVSYSLQDSIVNGGKEALGASTLIVKSIQKLIEGKVPLSSIGSPILIAKVAGDRAKEGLVSFLWIVGFVSINLGLLNFLPIPILDGGHIVFYGWEMIFRKPMNIRVREIGQQLGLIFLISLMVLAIYNDLIRFIFKRGFMP
ncbi:MAG: RIP metalloprotease RseP [Desulfuromonadales bacterium]|nr:RIP metalloprotease RseP [Desulfuromonadales bacterium]